MTDWSPTTTSRSRLAVLKVLYLITVTATIFAVPAVDQLRPLRWWIVGTLFLIQALFLITCGVAWSEVFRPLSRLKWLLAVLLLVYALLPSDDERVTADWHSINVYKCTIWINLVGLKLAAFMCLQILTVLLTASVVRLTGPGTDLVVGLRTLGLPKLFVYPLDMVLAKLSGSERRGSGQGHGNGRGGRRRAGEARTGPGFFAVLNRLIRGDVSALTSAIQTELQQARQQVEADSNEKLDAQFTHDAAIITGIGLVMVGFKMLKVLPGVPIASGHKTLLLFPLYILAARLTHSRWGGTLAGAVMGVIGFLQGDGRFGLLEIFKHIAPGLVIDLLMPLVRRLPERAWVYCILGFLAGLARLLSEFIVLMLLGTRAEVYLFFAAKLLPTLIAGLLSGFVAVAMLRVFPNEGVNDTSCDSQLSHPSNKAMPQMGDSQLTQTSDKTVSQVSDSQLIQPSVKAMPQASDCPLRPSAPSVLAGTDEEAA